MSDSQAAFAVVLVENARVAQTDVGRLCFRNGVRGFDIFACEEEIQNRIDHLRRRPRLDEVHDVIDAVSDVFLQSVELIDAGDLVRLQEYAEARAFYAIFIGWRTRNESFKQRISHFVGYWTQIVQPLVYVGRSGARRSTAASGRSGST